MRRSEKNAGWRLDFPIAAIRGEGTSDDYMPPKFRHCLPSVCKAPFRPALPKQNGLLDRHGLYHQPQDLGARRYILRIPARNPRDGDRYGNRHDFHRRFANSIPHGALLLVSDNPLVPEGVKTEESDKKVTPSYVKMHLEIGIESLTDLARSGASVKHMRFEN
jgi:AMP nucleosidase